MPIWIQIKKLTRHTLIIPHLKNYAIFDAYLWTGDDQRGWICLQITMDDDKRLVLKKLKEFFKDHPKVLREKRIQKNKKGEITKEEKIKVIQWCVVCPASFTRTEKNHPRSKFSYDGSKTFKETEDFGKINIEQNIIPFPLLGDTYPTDIIKEMEELDYVQTKKFIKE